MEYFFTTSSWIIVTLLTKPTENNTLIKFYNKIKPYGVGWRGFLLSNKIQIKHNKKDSPMRDILLMILGILTVYFGLFGVGFLIYGNILMGTLLIIISFISTYAANYIMSNIDNG